MLQGKTVVLGVTGSIAAYKIASLASRLVKLHADVHVIMTPNATHFITPITFETLTGNKCLVDTFDRNFQFHVAHVSLAQRADVLLIAPASADVIGKIANGIADDMLTTTVMACTAPVLISPAMNTHMYENPIVQDNLQKLRSFGYTVIEPAVGMLACRDVGAGKMPEPEVLLQHLLRDTAGDTLLHSYDHGSHCATCKCASCESRFYDSYDRCRYCSDVCDHDDQCQCNIENCHKRYNDLGYLCDSPDSAENDKSYAYGKYQTCNYSCPGICISEKCYCVCFIRVKEIGNCR